MSDDPDVSTIRSALSELSNAQGPDAKRAALARANTVGQQVAMTISDPGKRGQFVSSLEADIRQARDA
ncbi:hypothetical protein [Kutzneria buriramensis]|uniref:Uncharacterized protein n=1 Tax=Kutzneria buriramensis TaxID=1045776 RepID=A0A3E0G5C0_9PSEU|nr:hypothetical protein [Kutzneria buriramensis]REH18041.1 hypothetical protein BCF44_13828 [Kutzneria buriramensis]